MTGYHEDDPRTQFQACPGCQADIDRDSTRCEFCECEFDIEHLSDDSEPETRLASTEAEVTTDKTTRYLVLLTLNIATGMVSVLTSALEEPGTRGVVSPSAPPLAAEQREEMIQFLQQQNRAQMETLSARLEEDVAVRRTRSTPVRF